ncbi:MAG: hypothetical protein WC100_03530 [Sterolibacterium sp.]
MDIDNEKRCVAAQVIVELFDNKNVQQLELLRLRAAIALSVLGDKRQEMMGRIASELDRAYEKHGREQWGRHEFYAILKEEVDELWDCIKRDEPMENVEKEMLQVAAMCFRYFETGNRSFKGKP